MYLITIGVLNLILYKSNHEYWLGSNTSYKNANEIENETDVDSGTMTAQPTLERNSPIWYSNGDKSHIFLLKMPWLSDSNFIGIL